MVERVIKVIVNQMESENIIVTDMKEYYLYALLTMVEKIITISTIICISAIFQNVIPTLFFLVSFLSLRQRTGGYHADKFWKCYIGTIVTYILIQYFSNILVEQMKIVYVGVLISCVIICVIGTVNHPNMEFTAFELQESKKAARYLLILECLFLVAIDALKICKCCVVYMSVAIILCAFLLCLAKIKKQEVIVYEKK